MDRINELLASSYNLHVGPKIGGDAMTPARAAKLPRPDKAALCHLLQQRGGSDLFSKEDARRALVEVVAS